jgi:hypothetical protein
MESEYDVKLPKWISSKGAIKLFVCLHGDKTYNSFVCGNTT